MDVNIEKVIKSLDGRNRRPSVLLFSNKRNNNIRHNGSSFFMTCEKTGKYIPLTGLLPVLKTCFWSNSNLDTSSPPIEYYYNQQYSNPKSTKTITTTTNNKNHNKGRFFGALRGSAVHQQLEDFIQLDEKNFIKKYKTLHPWTDRVIRSIIDRGWRPLKGEFNVYDPSLVIGTSIDMICVDKKGKLIFLELKTGYSGYFQKNNGYMNGPLFGILHDSALNRAMLQLSFSMLFVIKYHKIENMEGWVIRIDSEQLEYYRVQERFLLDYSQQMYRHVYRSRKDNRRKISNNK